ncbi:hypothetical protein LSS_19825 [Leptospira santarosai serovar Shermani str. LT 821]|uniref:Uncharacterized protein n=1 Tax=Leptospira santarosai serovar Shermani str. LT 821 TaxID=758847 RepID=K8XTQ0_9LEPT|nr:hypothetical protein LSS_19825 [Leptospira santarosai serovar Shermani str. LT 821]
MNSSCALKKFNTEFLMIRLQSVLKKNVSVEIK